MAAIVLQLSVHWRESTVNNTRAKLSRALLQQPRSPNTFIYKQPPDSQG